VSRQERQARDELVDLAARPEGRRLLQLALRGIQESGRGLTYGCWVKRDGGVSGCLFQHAYWQGLREGVFAPVEQVAPKLREFVGTGEDFVLVMRCIRAFDALGRRRFRRWQRGPLGLPAHRLDERRWRATIERLLVEALAESPGEAGAGTRARPAPPVSGAHV
jgi:hypothetical protein